MTTSPPDGQETKLAFVDGRDALAFVIVRPSDAGVSVEAAANGLSHKQAAHILRTVASRWDHGVPIPPEVACPWCGGYVRGHQWIGVDSCSVNHVEWDR